mmetsp:Transcript_18440/g.30715  ORF Transcript_18440/g.30715 Transcript_18440/m.30715 type:complete len:645 (+) Transcript_18440:153-2087(+)|eukprot:CAMPEP_0114420280 /NCGR_PEP_ID=MMETSP0103-20121206/4476_1 /TAXON_ID=37642 ORGANISM="Paraphysomonas imperforata, Strain PA2" /NCGR_SAMPLE_ID=MMETSP0103 /ASSEMBLY_ACC=CAM_ASM_000201 /LENGTH=644 /DNA_ID=CAMNT_0001588755 /DNA_START=153 /DNA_END=2087 /DNA_ORIENTATION=+
MALSDILRARQEERKKGLNFKKQAEYYRAKFKREENLKVEAEERERKRRIEQIEEEKRLKKIADDEAERIYKTKEYIQLDYLMRPSPEEGHPMYYGENIATKHGTWIPHGQGSLHFDDQKFYEGKWENGIMHGTACFTQDDGTIWEGTLIKGKIHGVGYLTRNGKRDEVLAYHNVVHCFRSELYDGKQVEIDDPSLRLGSNTLPRVTIMSHRKKWSFKCRFHDEVQPRERYVDFSTLKNFTILHHLPLVYDQTRFNIPLEADTRYNYWEDVYGQITRPKLGHAGGRAGPEQRPQGVKIKAIEEKPTSDYSENVFESQEMGIGRSLMEKERLRVEANKIEAWNKSLAEKRELENQERNRLVAEEEARVLAEAQAKQMEKAKQRKAESDKLRKQIEEENEKWDSKDSAMGELKQSRDRQLALERQESQSAMQESSLRPLSRDEMRTPTKRRVLGGDQEISLVDSPLKSLVLKESKLQTKALRVLPRIQSRYMENRKRMEECDFNYGVVEFIKGSVNFTYYDDYVGSAAETIPAFIGFSLESDMTDDPKPSSSVLPAANEETRMYLYYDLSMVSFEMTANKLATETLEVFLFEDVKGKKPTKIGAAFFDFENVKNNVGDEVQCTAPFSDGDEERGVVQLTMRAIAME